MEELTPAQALAEFEGGLSYAQLEKKHGISNHSAQSLVKRGRKERDGGEEPPETVTPPIFTAPTFSGDDLEHVIRVPESVPPEELYRVIKPISHEPLSGGGPFNVGDILCIDSFPHRKYSERRLWNLLMEGKLVKL